MASVRRATDDRGFALLIVLWSLVLVALLVAEMGSSSRQESKIARNLMANAVTEAAADGAVHEAIFRLSDGSDQAWQADGAPRHLTVAGIPVDLHIDDEAGKINPNLADPALLQALMLVVGADPIQAQTVALAISDWRGGAAVERQAVIAQRYQAAGLHYQPTFSPFEAVADVGLVLGMTPELAARVLPHLSVHQIGLADPGRADPVVAKALAQLPGATAQAAPAVAQAYRSLTIVAVAHGAEGASFTRRAVVRTGPGLPRGYAVLVWDAPAG